MSTGLKPDTSTQRRQGSIYTLGDTLAFYCRPMDSSISATNGRLRRLTELPFQMTRSSHGTKSNANIVWPPSTNRYPRPLSWPSLLRLPPLSAPSLLPPWLCPPQCPPLALLSQPWQISPPSSLSTPVVSPAVPSPSVQGPG